MASGKFNWQRAVIKVGSALIAPQGDGCRTEYLLAIARFVIQARAAGKQVILVSSGSVAAGSNAVAYSQTPTISDKQAMAAVGQTRMMANWARLFDFPCAQILLTHADIADRHRYVNIKNTLRSLLASNVLPIVNENDTVATDELKFGDNDNLASMVALVSDADSLIICTDVAGLYDADPKQNPQAQLMSEIEQLDEQTMALAGGTSGVGTGGMRSKLQAAKKASEQGIQTLIVNGTDAEVFSQLALGVVKGTLVHAQQSHTNAKKYWLKHGLKVKGQVVVDQGAVSALRERGASLLPAGVVDVKGHFQAGDAVDIVYQHKTIARGLSLFSAADLQAIKGQHSQQIDQRLGYTSQGVVVHRDDLAII